MSYFMYYSSCIIFTAFIFIIIILMIFLFIYLYVKHFYKILNKMQMILLKKLLLL